MNFSYTRTRYPIDGYHRRAPGTPLSQWKYIDGGRGDAAELSARKLAAGVWHLHLSLLGGSRAQFQDNETGNVGKYSIKCEDIWQRGSPCIQVPEKRSKHCTEPYYLQKYMKLLKHQATTISLVSALQTKLSQAQSQFLHLEANYNSCKTRFQHLMRNIIHQRNSEKRRVHTVISTLREALTTERRNREKIESSAKRIMQEYEKEKRGKEMAEEVCRELAKIIAEDEMELEGLKREAVMIREEVEEERRMYELAEIWREERAQMKMVDAKLALECKLDEMNKLVSELERFLGSQASALMSTSEIRKGEMIRQAIRSLDDDGSNYQIVAVVDDQSGLESRNHKRPDSENPHVIRGMKGFVEWPRCNKRKSQFKSKLFKTLLKSQKSRFRIMC